MSGFLGYRQQSTAVQTKNNKIDITQALWVMTWAPADMPAQDFEVWHGAIRGPGGYFLVYIDDAMFGAAENGAINEYGPRGKPMYVRKAQTITMHFSIGSGKAPVGWLWLQQPPAI